MSIPYFQLLLIPLRRDITQFRHQIHELRRQFDTIRHDPHAYSTKVDKQDAYKARVLRWYFQGVPRAKQDLLHRLLAFWTAVPSAVAVMEFYRAVDDEYVVREVEMWQLEVCGLANTVAAMFTSVIELQHVNPKWFGAEKCPLFTIEGCVLETEPGSRRSAAWEYLLES